ncbi:helix-turn-helix domain-containing protein, partial [Fischerella thermalis]|uniref:helix-turn-helix domain-containing protein n=1 Tax=Fischerella thermalis TaxID=372787 RepID=UPI00307E2EE1
GKSLLLGYVYKLRPKQVQVVKMDNWLDMLRANYNWSLADRIDTYQQRFNRGEYCDLKTKSVAVPQWHDSRSCESPHYK